MVSSTIERGYVPIGSDIMMTEAYHDDTKADYGDDDVLAGDEEYYCSWTDCWTGIWWQTIWHSGIYHEGCLPFAFDSRPWSSMADTIWRPRGTLGHKRSKANRVLFSLFHGFTLPSVASVATFFFFRFSQPQWMTPGGMPGSMGMMPCMGPGGMPGNTMPGGGMGGMPGARLWEWYNLGEKTRV